MITTLSETGSYHKSKNLPNQDVVYSAENERFCFSALADGVTSCPKGDVGARLACRSIADMLLESGEYYFGFSGEKTALYVIGQILENLDLEAKEEGRSINDYSSTLMFVLYDKIKKKFLYFSIGDGIILGGKKDGCKVICQPGFGDAGSFATTTKGVENIAFVGIGDAYEYDSLLMCSDGAWRKMYLRDRMKNEPKLMIQMGNYTGLSEFLRSKDDYDDYSYVSLCFEDSQRRIWA